MSSDSPGTGADDRRPTHSLRGPGRAAAHGYPQPAPGCAAMAVGSVPHHDPAEAVELVFRHTPEIPAWPQLPRRSYHENMYVQFSRGLPGLVIDDTEERIFVREPVDDAELLAFVEGLESGDAEVFGLTEDEASALPEFLARLETHSAPFVKGQVTGPISLSLSVAFENRRALVYDDTFREAISRLIGAKAKWQEALLSCGARDSLPLIMYDEPYLTQTGSGLMALPSDTFEHLAASLESVGCLRGIHVCGGTDWARVASLPVDALNFDAADHLDALAAYADAVGQFVEEGGLLVWGAVPNDGRAERMTGEDAGRIVVGGAELLASHAGADEDIVLRSSFVSPACGTGTLPPNLAERCFTVTHEGSAWLQERL